VGPSERLDRELHCGAFEALRGGCKIRWRESMRPPSIQADMPGFIRMLSLPPASSDAW
jgi:hypothetical protein